MAITPPHGLLYHSVKLYQCDGVWQQYTSPDHRVGITQLNSQLQQGLWIQSLGYGSGNYSVTDSHLRETKKQAQHATGGTPDSSLDFIRHRCQSVATSNCRVKPAPQQVQIFPRPQTPHLIIAPHHKLSARFPRTNPTLFN